MCMCVVRTKVENCGAFPNSSKNMKCPSDRCNTTTVASEVLSLSGVQLIKF